MRQRPVGGAEFLNGMRKLGTFIKNGNKKRREIKNEEGGESLILRA